MIAAEKLIEFSEKLPGYYGYRPTLSDEGELLIEEIMFRLTEKKENEEVDYLLSFYFSNNRCVDALLDARYSDGSVATVKEGDIEFEDIVGHKNKVTKLLNKLN